MPTRTILVNGNGTGTLSFQLDGPDVTDVEAVLAEIDTGGAGDTTATLTATSPAGSDVAAVPQGQPIAGGGQGRATWALRLAEDGAGSAGGALKTTDGVAVINPTTELLIGLGLLLQPSGPGGAAISTWPGIDHFVGHWGAAANTNGVPRPLSLDDAASMFLQFGHNIVVPSDGYYLIVANGEISQPAPAGAGMALTVAVVAAVDGMNATATVPLDSALAAGSRSRRLSAVSVVFIPSSEPMQVLVGNGGAGPNTSTAGGTVAIARLF